MPARRDRRLRRGQRGVQPAQHQLLDRRIDHAVRAGGGRGPRAGHQGAWRDFVRPGLPVPGRREPGRRGAGRAADEGDRGRPLRRGRHHRRGHAATRPVGAGARVAPLPAEPGERPFPRHLRPGAGQHLRLPGAGRASLRHQHRRPGRLPVCQGCHRQRGHRRRAFHAARHGHRHRHRPRQAARRRRVHLRCAGPRAGLARRQGADAPKAFRPILQRLAAHAAAASRAARFASSALPVRETGLRPSTSEM